MEQIKVGIIGFGLSGRVFHAGVLKHHPKFKILAVSSSRAYAVKEELPEAEVFSSAQDLIKNKDVDLIINCAPNDAHFSLTKFALENGKHVVVEKPFVNTLADGEKLIALAMEKSLVLSIFQNRRWDADFLTIKKLLADRTLGKIKQFESHFDRWRPLVRGERWREQASKGSGVWFDLGPHLVDQALQLFGAPTEIVADIATQKIGAVTDDYFHVILKYDEMRVILHSTSFSASSPRFRILGDSATFTKYGLDPQEQQLAEGLSILSERFGKEAQENRGILKFPDRNESTEVESKRGSYPTFYDELAESIRTGSPPPVTGQEALQVIEVIEQAIRSSTEGRAIKIGRLLTS